MDSTLNTLIGLGIIYLWIYSGVIIYRKIENLTTKETAVLIGSLASLVLVILGSIA